MNNKQVPIGIRLNNPGNLEWGDPWQGLVPRAESMYANSKNAQQARFAQFKTPAYGIRALARTLITYKDKHGITTVAGAINRWAPPTENNTQAYVKQVEKSVGGKIVDLHEYEDLRAMTEAIIRHENGQGSLRTPNSWFTAAEIDEGLRLAGVRPKSGKLPVTAESVGASATGVLGVAELVEVLPAVSTALTNADGHLTSGNLSRLIIGLVMIGIAVVIAWAQVKKHKSGVL